MARGSTPARARALRRSGCLVLLLLVAACTAPAPTPPYWRRPGPAVTQPPPNETPPEQGFRAARATPMRSG